MRLVVGLCCLRSLQTLSPHKAAVWQWWNSICMLRSKDQGCGLGQLQQFTCVVMSEGRADCCSRDSRWRGVSAMQHFVLCGCRCETGVQCWRHHKTAAAPHQPSCPLLPADNARRIGIAGANCCQREDAQPQVARVQHLQSVKERVTSAGLTASLALAQSETPAGETVCSTFGQATAFYLIAPTCTDLTGESRSRGRG